jgi:uncharacterized membrane protein YgcG
MLRTLLTALAIAHLAVASPTPNQLEKRGTCTPRFNGIGVSIVSSYREWYPTSLQAGQPVNVQYANYADTQFRIENTGQPDNGYIIKLDGVSDNSLVVSVDAGSRKLQVANKNAIWGRDPNRGHHHDHHEGDSHGDWEGGSGGGGHGGHGGSGGGGWTGGGGGSTGGKDEWQYWGIECQWCIEDASGAYGVVASSCAIKNLKNSECVEYQWNQPGLYLAPCANTWNQNFEFWTAL